jgi:Ca2+-binding EF-hand superfamily protein
MKYLIPCTLMLSACTPVDPHSEAAHGRKVMGLQEKFDRFDYNADGKITRNEAEIGIKESGVTGVSDEELDSMMKHYDVNNDGAISRWETQRAIDTPIPEHN